MVPAQLGSTLLIFLVCFSITKMLLKVPSQWREFTVVCRQTSMIGKLFAFGKGVPTAHFRFKCQTHLTTQLKTKQIMSVFYFYFQDKTDCFMDLHVTADSAQVNHSLNLPSHCIPSYVLFSSCSIPCPERDCLDRPRPFPAELDKQTDSFWKECQKSIIICTSLQYFSPDNQQ